MTLDFADGLTDLATNPFPADRTVQPATKPPSLDALLWHRIPNAKRREYIRRMAHGLVRGVHPDDTVTELLATVLISQTVYPTPIIPSVISHALVHDPDRSLLTLPAPFSPGGAHNSPGPCYDITRIRKTPP